MNIGLDFDDTYTRNPAMWDKVIKLWRQSGCKVYLVTWRDEGSMGPVYERLDGKVDGFYPTDCRGKRTFMFEQGICIDVWVDDNPNAIVSDIQPLTFS